MVMVAMVKVILPFFIVIMNSFDAFVLGRMSMNSLYCHWRREERGM